MAQVESRYIDRNSSPRPRPIPYNVDPMTAPGQPLNSPDTIYDYTVIGAGIVGLATALQLKRQEPQRTVLVIEKEPEVALHQTDHNSGVIHAGVYYAPGSLKAEFCKHGAQATKAFCREHGIPFQQPGKLLVATSATEYQRMLDLQQRCIDNGIEAELMDKSGLQALEPRITGLGALRVKQSAIVDYRQISRAMADQFQSMGGIIRTGAELRSVQEKSHALGLNCSNQHLHTRIAVSCTGLMADRICDLFGIARDFSILPFRGEYYELTETKSHWVEHLIYPIPDPSMPFLGVHLTPTVNGRLTVGPNAVMGWKREGYRQWGNLSLRDAASTLGFPGFWHLLRSHWRSGLNELANSYYKPRYLSLVRKYCPGITINDLKPHPPGIRAQAVTRRGELIHDFLFEESKRSLHVCNAPSPAATSAIPIGEHIAALVQRKRAALSDRD